MAFWGGGFFGVCGDFEDGISPFSVFSGGVVGGAGWVGSWLIFLVGLFVWLVGYLMGGWMEWELFPLGNGGGFGLGLGWWW